MDQRDRSRLAHASSQDQCTNCDRRHTRIAVSGGEDEAKEHFAASRNASSLKLQRLSAAHSDEGVTYKLTRVCTPEYT